MRWLASVALLVMIVAPAIAQDDAGAQKKKRDRNVITIEEIDGVRDGLQSARDIVDRLRPQFLRGRGASSLGNAGDGNTVELARVVLDGVTYGGIEALSQIPASAIREIRYLNGTEASIQFGTGYGGGAIVVSTRQGN